ncbi:MAG: hypothetical protein QF594_05435 [Dehalococcoidales bacterium]|nr:hypothetical protein [Dehalococcoidales bacterium]
MACSLDTAVDMAATREIRGRAGKDRKGNINQGLIPNKITMVVFDKCQRGNYPVGTCAAVSICPHRLIKQETHGEIPMFHPTAYRGYGNYAWTYPLKTIAIIGV